MYKEKKALLLDMNSTFMFGEDRFGENEDFFTYYRKIGGSLKRSELNHIIMSAYEYLDVRYPDEKYRHNFPSLMEAIEKSSDIEISSQEIEIIVNTFAFHELGHIPQEFIGALHKLKERFILAAGIDCILVAGASDPRASGCYSSLLEFNNEIQ